MAPTTGQTISCKGAVCWGPGELLVIEEVEVDPPQIGEVRIKILYSSLCRSDVTFWQDKPKIGLFPRIFGHEASGIVESVGGGVTEFVEGDHVLPLFTGECMKCVHCKSAKSNVCEKFRISSARGVMLSDKKSRFKVKGKPVYHYSGSTFCQYTVLEQENVVKIDPVAPLDKVCLLSCGVPAGLSSVWKVAKVEKGSTVAIFGLGTVGLAVAAGAQKVGAKQIIGIDVRSKKFERALQFGVTDCINPLERDKPIQEVIKEMTAGGVDYSFECVGSAQVVESALLSCHDGWGMTIICGVAGEKTPFAVHPAVLLLGRTITGTLFGGLKPKSDLPKFVEMYMNKEFSLEDFITHELPLSQINDAFKLLIEGDSLRSVIHL
ncbi:hypothetical protein GOP47_0029367 [Adiantum capillus-veneris]|nr:hypothetical protein GOP47_0029367 [Adiantum capillus-veneris]